jgi:hypothetical protein
MKPRRDKGRIDGPFVPLLVETMATSAWKAMSPYARVVYIALKSRYSFKARNNARIFLSARDGAEETGLNKTTVARALRELEHYGFIVQTDGGCLGVNGKGKAPHWRLTEIGYMTEQPSRDFLKWDGELFREHKDYIRKNRIPSVRNGQGVCPERTPSSVLNGQLQTEVSVQNGHTGNQGCPAGTDISRVTISVPSSGSAPPRLRR